MRKVNCKGKKIQLSQRMLLAQEQRKNKSCSGITLNWRWTQILAGGECPSSLSAGVVQLQNPVLRCSVINLRNRSDDVVC